MNFNAVNMNFDVQYKPNLNNKHLSKNNNNIFNDLLSNKMRNDKNTKNSDNYNVEDSKVSNQTKTNETKTNETKTNQTKTNQTKTNETEKREFKTNNTKYNKTETDNNEELDMQNIEINKMIDEIDETVSFISQINNHSIESIDEIEFEEISQNLQNIKDNVMKIVDVLDSNKSNVNYDNLLNSINNNDLNLEQIISNSDLNEVLTQLKSLKDSFESISNENSTEEVFLENNVTSKDKPLIKEDSKKDHTMKNINNFTANQNENTEFTENNFSNNTQSQTKQNDLNKITLDKPINIENFKDEIFTKLVENSKVLLNNDKSEMKLTLKPDFLGEMTLKISVEKGIVTAKAVVDSEFTKGIIESNIINLKESLKNQGMDIEKFEVITNGNADLNYNSESNSSFFSQNDKRNGFKRNTEEISELYDESIDIDEFEQIEYSSLDIKA